MAASNHTIETEEQISEILGNPDNNTVEKISDRLDDLAQDFIRSSTLVFVSTVDKDGKLDVSPKGDGPG
ncbi:MAG: pyridoxamine 5'-phosphate oxidase family protein, partial [Pseudomonadota bacterium]